VVHEDVRVKLNLQWKTQEIRHPRNEEHWVKKDKGSEQSQPKRVVI
jgi:hypothetical protein